MNNIFKTLSGIAILLALIFSSCSNNPKTNSQKKPVGLETERGEHNRDTGSGGEGEESGTRYGLDDKYDVVRNGARLILSYETESNSFKGTVENTTNEVLKRVRVEVHLSNGTELGPTSPTDLKPGEKIAVNLAATEKEFDGWF